MELAERDEMQRQGVLPRSWCKGNVVTLLFLGLEHGQNWSTSALVSVVSIPNPNPSTGARAWPSSW